MAFDIDILGEIGWEVTQIGVKDQFAAIDSKKDIKISLSSPGGSVFQGVKIGHMIRDHEGKTTLEVSSSALSMGSHIMQNADVIKVHEDTAFMMHNPWMFTGGDHIELQKDVDLLKSLAGLLSIRYAKNSQQEKKAIRKLMDETTWLVGQEIVDAGFAHEVIESEGETESREDAITYAKLEFEECMMKLKVFEGAADDYKKIAALLPPVTPKPAKIPVSKTQKPGKPMNEAEFLAFLATNPDAKAFFDSAMAYIKDVSDQAQPPDLSAMSLPDVLVLAPQAATEQETALADAAKAVETGKLNKTEAKFLITAVASGEYGESVNDVVVDAFSGEASYREAKRTISQADESNAKFKLLQVQSGQPESTPAGGVDAGDDTSINSPKIQASVKKFKSLIGV